MSARAIVLSFRSMAIPSKSVQHVYGQPMVGWLKERFVKSSRSPFECEDETFQVCRLKTLVVLMRPLKRLRKSQSYLSSILKCIKRQDKILQRVFSCTALRCWKDPPCQGSSIEAQCLIIVAQNCSLQHMVNPSGNCRGIRASQERAPTVVYIDEIDAIAGSRKDSKGQLEKRILTHC